MRIDAHHHLWDANTAKYSWMTAEYGAIRRAFGPDDLRPLLDRCGVDRTVIVQTWSSLEESYEFLATAARTPFIAGVVAWVDLTDGSAAETIAALRAAPGGGKLVGIRHQVHDEADPAWLLRPDVQRSLTAVAEAGLTYDLLVRPRELPAAHETVVRHPRMRFVINHLAKPPIRDGGSPAWEEWMPQMAALPNVYCKLSGLVTEADWHRWTVEDLRPYVARALDWFGPDRMLFGSDWPVCLLAAPYDRVVDAAQQLISGLSPAEQDAVFGRTAIAAYALPPA
jgi:L-fuconolactonase